jgi:DNA-binding transcriptional MerR regulator
MSDIMIIRKGKEHYAKHYYNAISMHKEGLPVGEIASKLGISYSAVYHWVKEIRKPEAGNVSDFIGFLSKNGPMPVIDIENKFPKHNELFLIAVRRNLPVKRYMMQKKYGEYSTWYYMEGHEKQLEERLEQLMDKIKEVKEKINSLK